MNSPSLVVIDDFYRRPDVIRDLACSLTFEKTPGVNYPGGQAIAALDWSPIREILQAYLPSYHPRPSPKATEFPQGMFRLALADDELTRPDGVHQDAQRWSAVIYLSRNQDCNGGVAFYRHLETGALAASADWERVVFGRLLDEPDEVVRPAVKAYFRDPRHWIEVEHVAMRYNRAVLLMAQRFHASRGVFGSEPANGRLTQHFEFY